MPEVNKPNNAENKTGVLENLGIIDEIKKGIDEIRNGIRENIASVWDGFKGLLGKGIKKLLGIPVEDKEQTTEPETNKPAEQNAEITEEKPKETNLETAQESILKIEESELFKKVIEQFQKEIDQPIKTVCYPASGFMSINESFKDAKVTYIDTEESAVKAHQTAKHTAIKADLGEYKPEEKPDLSILLNPAAKADKIKKYLENVAEEKFVICNNYHGTANLLHDDSSFELLGVIPPDASKMDKDQLEDYFTKVTSDDDFKAKDPVSYEKAIKLIKEKNGDPKNNIIKQYIEFAGEEAKSNLPPKKGGDSAGFQTYYFIFKRKKEEAQTVQQAA